MWIWRNSIDFRIFKCRSPYASLWILLVNLCNLLLRLSTSCVVIIKLNNSESWSVRFDDVLTHRSEMVYKFRSRVFNLSSSERIFIGINKFFSCSSSCSFGYVHDWFSCALIYIMIQKYDFHLAFLIHPDRPHLSRFVETNPVLFESWVQDNLAKFISYKIAMQLHKIVEKPPVK